MDKSNSMLSKFNPKNMISKWRKILKIIFTKNIDTSTPEGREQKRQKAITLTALIATVAKIIALLIPFITVKATKKYLGDDIYGLWSSVNSFFAVFAFADLGLGSGLQTNLSKATGKDNNEEECKRLISSTFIMLFSVAGIIIFLFLCCYFFIDWASLVNATSPEAIVLAGPVFLAIVIPKLIDIPIALTQRTQVALQEGYIEVLIQKPDGEQWLLEVDKELDEDLGIEFENGLMDEYRHCHNKCIFCFIDQMPKGMRETLYFKDDDSRLSFLQGNYVTLTNMSDHDIDRITRYHLSPINISFQTMNPKLRCEMLNNRFAGEALKKVDTLYEAGITMNGQIVLCKGVNDGEELEYSIQQLTKYLQN